ncbi:MAG: hypothetical protein MZV63_17440 [Marinilabiliales bacterium]|nr:hypothetical protein [Marinilabiliales bacterium]
MPPPRSRTFEDTPPPTGSASGVTHGSGWASVERGTRTCATPWLVPASAGRPTSAGGRSPVTTWTATSSSWSSPSSRAWSW